MHPFNNQDELFEQVCFQILSQGNSRCRRPTLYKNRQTTPGVPHMHGLNGERSPVGMFIPDHLYQYEMELKFFSLDFFDQYPELIYLKKYYSLLYKLECDWYNICQHTPDENKITLQHFSSLKENAKEFGLKLPVTLQNFDLLK